MELKSHNTIFNELDGKERGLGGEGGGREGEERGGERRGGEGGQGRRRGEGGGGVDKKRCLLCALHIPSPAAPPCWQSCCQILLLDKVFGSARVAFVELSRA